MRIVKLPQALADLVDTAEYIAKESPDTADRFFDAFEEAVELIKHTPKIGAIRLFENRIKVRMWPIKGFERSLIFYTSSADEIVILRVIHSSRDYTKFFEDS